MRHIVASLARIPFQRTWPAHLSFSIPNPLLDVWQLVLFTLTPFAWKNSYQSLSPSRLRDEYHIYAILHSVCCGHLHAAWPASNHKTYYELEWGPKWLCMPFFCSIYNLTNFLLVSILVTMMDDMRRRVMARKLTGMTKGGQIWWMLCSSMPFYDNAIWSTTFKDEEGVGRASSKSLFSFFYYIQS